MRATAKPKSRAPGGALKSGTIEERKANLEYLEKQVTLIKKALAKGSLDRITGNKMKRYDVSKKLLWHKRKLRKEEELIIQARQQDGETSFLAIVEPRKRKGIN